MVDMYTGQVQGVSLIATGTPSSFCRKVSSGSLKINSNNIRNVGIGGQLLVRKGTSSIELELTCVGVDKTNLAFWFPTTAGATVASFPDFLVEVDDGSGGVEFILSGGQPGSCTVSCSNAADAVTEYKLTATFTTATLQAVGTDVPVYNSYSGHTINDVHVQVGAADCGVLSFDLSNDLGAKVVNTMDTKATGSKTFATGVIITGSDPKISFTTTELLGVTAMLEDTWTPSDVTLTFSNGVTAEDMTITCGDFVPASFDMPLEAEDLVAFGHEYVAGGVTGTVYNRITIA